jgi:hypothetical protein
MSDLRQPGSTAPRRPTDTGLSSQQYICDGPCKRKLFVLGRRKRGPLWYCSECDDARQASRRAAVVD